MNGLGLTMDVQVEAAHALDAMRELGAQGWSPREIPAGGIVLPYEMADTFDWSLIGAREWTNPEGEHIIFHLGHSYTRRAFDENKKKSMPAAIKYSRGAKATDPDHLIEKVAEGEAGKGYVTLAIFKGGGKSLREYTKQRGNAHDGDRAPAAGPPGDTVDQDVGHRGARPAAPASSATGAANAAPPPSDVDPLSALSLPHRRQVGALALAVAKVDVETPPGRQRLALWVRDVCGAWTLPNDKAAYNALLERVKKAAAA